MNSRESIFAALFTKWSAAQGLVTTSRTLRHWTDVAPADQAAGFQVELPEEARTEYRKPTRWTFRADIVLYVHAQSCGTPDVVTAMNNLIDAVIASIDRDATGQQTLGGVVEDCRVHGTIEKDEGRLGPQAVAVIPVEIIPLL